MLMKDNNTEFYSATDSTHVPRDQRRWICLEVEFKVTV